MNTKQNTMVGIYPIPWSVLARSWSWIRYTRSSLGGVAWGCAHSFTIVSERSLRQQIAKSQLEGARGCAMCIHRSLGSLATSCRLHAICWLMRIWLYVKFNNAEAVFLSATDRSDPRTDSQYACSPSYHPRQYYTDKLQRRQIGRNRGNQTRGEMLCFFCKKIAFGKSVKNSPDSNPELVFPTK